LLEAVKVVASRTIDPTRRRGPAVIRLVSDAKGPAASGIGRSPVGAVVRGVEPCAADGNVGPHSGGPTSCAAVLGDVERSLEGAVGQIRPVVGDNG